MNIFDRFRLDGKKAFVTGGARGIGKYAAIALAQAGADIAIIDRDMEPAQAAAEEIAAFGTRTLAVGADVSEYSDVQSMMVKILSEFGTVDIAFNNAGICINKNTQEMSLEEWKKVIDINLTGIYLTAKAAGMVMVAKKAGSIINTGSMAGHIIPEPQYHCAYSASKAGVIHLTKSLAAEWGIHNVRVNSISPGYIDTGLTQAVQRRSWIERVPLKRIGKPEDLQGAVVYLASDASSFTTGSDILVDGGFCCW